MIDLNIKETSLFEIYNSSSYNDTFIALKLADEKIQNAILKTKGEFTKKKLNEIKTEINNEINKAYGGLFENMQTEVSAVSNVVAGAYVSNYSLPNSVIDELINSKRQIQGYGFKELFDLTESNHARQLRVLLSSGVAQGHNAMKIAREIGVKNSKLSKGQLKTNIYTTIAESRTVARHKSYEQLENEGIIKGYIYDATLDGRTTIYCREHDQRRYNQPINEIQHLINTHFNCIVGDSIIESPSTIKLITKRMYKGDIYVITTSKGNKITCTPNHPIFTNDGFLRANEINKSHKIGTNLRDVATISNVNNNEGVSTIENLFSSFAKSGKMFTAKMPITSKDFHGDVGLDENIDIVFTDSFLSGGSKTCVDNSFIDNSFIRGLSNRFRLFNSLTSSFSSSLTYFFTLFSNMGVFSLVKSLLITCNRPFNKFLLGLSSKFNTLSSKFSLNSHMRNIKSMFKSFYAYTVLVKSYTALKSHCSIMPLFKVQRNSASLNDNSLDNLWGKTKLFSNILTGSFGDKVFFDDIVSIEIRNDVLTHVYNLENELNYYTTNKVINHNCRSVFAPITETSTDSRRASQFGQVENQSYETWFKSQSKEFQKSTLTNRRYSDFLNNRYKVKGLSDLNGSVDLKEVKTLL